MKIILSILTSIILVISLAAHADGYQTQQLVAAPVMSQYMVSAVLKKNGEDATIRLVHSVESGISEDAAFGTFMRHVLEEFKGYSIADSIITQIPKAKTACTTL